MAKDKWRIGAAIQGSKRALLLRMFPAKLARVYCQGITYAYGVPGDYAFPDGEIDVRIIGIHRTATTEALVCDVNGQTHRPDGRRFVITLSTSADVAPATAGEIDEARIEHCLPIALSGMRLAREMLRPARFQTNRKAA